MAVYIMGDLHLSFGSEKPMDVFGARWENYVSKIETAWKETVGEEDTILLAGDTSWAIDLQELKPDFDYIEQLPGKKILSKGNHDLWWQTMNKMSAMMKQHHYETISFLHNNAHLCEDFIVVGTRGWYDETKEKVAENTDNAKIVARETMRLHASIEAGRRLDAENPADKPREMIAVLHFPAVFKDYICPEIVAELQKAGIRRCYYGHIHGNYESPARIEYEGITFHLISADYVLFKPERIWPLAEETDEKTQK